MPVMQIHLTRGCHSPAKIEELLVRCSQHFASVLECPVDRIRVYAIEHPADRCCIGGKLVSDGGAIAPYFSFVLMQGRTNEMKQKLMAGFTDLIEELLKVPRGVIRGGIVPVIPEDWSIAGIAASEVRKDEIRARSASAGAGN